ncbi:hypothetical protein BC835DRAFT_1310042 [Cytidiella melzeri]|nr:hypothetical protein BC835DRAFT_1310042 [Cytidiella melzeri]
MHAPSFFRILILVAECISFRYGMSPPNPPPSEVEQNRYKVDHKQPDSLPLQGSIMAIIWRALVYTASAIEILGLLPTISPAFSSYIPAILPKFPAAEIFVSPESVIALSILVFSTILRLHCYARLARIFTYELCLRDDHRLIQDGPYGVVRHPSYAGLYGLVIGNAVINFGRGGWWSAFLASGTLRFGGDMANNFAGATVAVGCAVVGALNILYLLPLPYSLAKRCEAEDNVLKSHFGEEWKQWTTKVPYRLVPGVW